MAWRYSVLDHDEAFVDEHEEESAVCVDCNEVTFDPFWDDENGFCEDCYINNFGEE